VLLDVLYFCGHVKPKSDMLIKNLRSIFIILSSTYVHSHLIVTSILLYYFAIFTGTGGFTSLLQRWFLDSEASCLASSLAPWHAGTHDGAAAFLQGFWRTLRGRLSAWQSTVQRARRNSASLRCANCSASFLLSQCFYL
jgi:hypothetical protein